MFRIIWNSFLIRLISSIAETLCEDREKDEIRRLKRHVFSFISKSLDTATSLIKGIIIPSFWVKVPLQYSGTLCKSYSINWDTLKSFQVLCLSKLKHDQYSQQYSVTYVFILKNWCRQTDILLQIGCRIWNIFQIKLSVHTHL